MSVFSKKLKVLRTDKGLTQKEIARMLEISETCYAGYEQGYREPDFNMLIKLCTFFNVSSDYLLGLEDEAGVKTYNNYGTRNDDVKF